MITTLDTMDRNNTENIVCRNEAKAITKHFKNLESSILMYLWNTILERFELFVICYICNICCLQFFKYYTLKKKNEFKSIFTNLTQWNIQGVALGLKRPPKC